MKSSHSPGAVSAVFDEPNLIADAGLVPLVRLAERVGLPGLVAERLRIDGAGNSGGAHPNVKVMTLVGAMCAGADSIDDADRLRHGAMGRLFGGVRAPSTLGTFLRSFTHGHNRQLHAVHRNFLARLVRDTPLLPAWTGWRSWTSTPPTGACSVGPSRVPRSDGPRAYAPCTQSWPPSPPRWPGL
ncbi:hypothetical protein [Streptomyces sp. NBC_00425]|uniref:hypothetical protein n=1 Tax=Streptomyces sp. NBC_00425 TaxID=2975740 RepID=UPI002E1BB066